MTIDAITIDMMTIDAITIDVMTIAMSYAMNIDAVNARRDEQ
jgi:hypothetical protein